MNVYETKAGTPVVELTDAEHRELLERQVREAVGMSVDEFVERARAGEIDWDDPETFYVAGIVDLDLRLNGHRQSV